MKTKRIIANIVSCFALKYCDFLCDYVVLIVCLTSSDRFDIFKFYINNICRIKNFSYFCILKTRVVGSISPRSYYNKF